MEDRQEDAGMDAAPQGAASEGRPDVSRDPDSESPQEGGQHTSSAAGSGEEDPLAQGPEGDPDAEQADPESGAAADQPPRPDAGPA
jgi:hypothetical protein